MARFMVSENIAGVHGRMGPGGSFAGDGIGATRTGTA
jgi:hypothetical protein